MCVLMMFNCWVCVREREMTHSYKQARFADSHGRFFDDFSRFKVDLVRGDGSIESDIRRLVFLVEFSIWLYVLIVRV